MSAFTDQLAEDMDIFLSSDEFGQDVLYNDGDGPVAVKGLVDLTGGIPEADSATIMVKKLEVPAPQYRHSFTIGSDVWHVSAGKGKNFIVSQDHASFVLAIRKGEKFRQW